MPWQFRKSVKIFPGVRLNFSKQGMGYSIGGRMLRYTVGPTGRRTRTIGIPGTGISHVETQKSGRGRARTQAAPVQNQAGMQAGQRRAGVPAFVWVLSGLSLLMMFMCASLLAISLTLS